MRIPLTAWLLAACGIGARTQNILSTSSGSVILTGTVASTLPAGLDNMPTGTYISYTSTVTLAASDQSINASSSSTFFNGTTTPATNTILVGTNSATSGTASSSAAQPSNTTPCNGYVEFCNRQYSNITMVTAHNSPFTNANNAARNQEYGVIAQLNDGVRMLQGQTHLENGTMWFCHTSCSLLNAGTVESYLAEVTQWLSAHPYEVVTILLGNSDYTTVQVNSYVSPLENSGITRYAFIPPKIPMTLGDWPTLGELILTNKRAIIFMDYNANQTAVPYILDEFSQMWETPYSPTDPAFPCTIQRPPGLKDTEGKNWLYMANHNLNTNLTLLGFSLLVPNTVDINTTNSELTNATSTLQVASDNCAGRLIFPSPRTTILPKLC